MAGQNHEIRLKLTKEQHDKIKSKADQLDMPISTFLKLLGLKSSLKVEVD